MHGLPQECVEFPLSRRRSVTATGAGSGYSTFHPVDPDIHTRILSLALCCHYPKMEENAAVYKPSTTVSPQPTIMVGVYKAAKGGIKSPSAGEKQWASTGSRRMNERSFIEAAKRAGECLTGSLSGSEVSLTTAGTNDSTSVKSEDEPRSDEKKLEGPENQPAFAEQASGSNNGVSPLKPASPSSYNQSHMPSATPAITGSITHGDPDNRSYEKSEQQYADPFGTYETVFLSQSDERLDELERISFKRRSGSKTFPFRKAANSWKSSIGRFSPKVLSHSSRSSLSNSFSNGKVASKSSIHKLSLQATLAFATTNQNTQPLPERHMHRTVHWLKGILSSHEPSTFQFAELPACISHDSNSNKEPNNLRNGLTENTVKDDTTEKVQTENAEAFTRTRDDLENLVNEALYIAHQVADKDEIGGKYTRSAKDQLPNKSKILSFIKRHNQLPIQTRQSSLSMRKIHRYNADPSIGVSAEGTGILPPNSRKRRVHPSLDGHEDADDEGSSEMEFVMSNSKIKETWSPMAANHSGYGGEAYEMQYLRGRNVPSRHISGQSLREQQKSLCLRGGPLINIDKRFNPSRPRRRQPIARDWFTARDGFWITVACVSTGLIGVYAGLVPSIQYYIADFHHYAMLGNVLFYVGLAVPTAVVWPLSLLHGRKSYVLGTMGLAMPLLLSQALAVNAQRSPYVATYRVGLILPRAFMGLTLGFANMNSMGILTDLFGASLQSSKSPQELVCSNDATRHGGGLDVWIGIWTWCCIGPIGMGFLIGACIINNQSPNWGLNVCVTIITGVLLLNIITPEVRRSEYRRSVIEARTINKGRCLEDTRLG